jgi:hypothetical protein
LDQVKFIRLKHRQKCHHNLKPRSRSPQDPQKLRFLSGLNAIRLIFWRMVTFGLDIVFLEYRPRVHRKLLDIPVGQQPGILPNSARQGQNEVGFDIGCQA